MKHKYILDTNVYIAAYVGYYHPDICASYWDILGILGSRGIVESPKEVRDEIKNKVEPTSKQKKGNETNFLWEWSRNKNNKCFLGKNLDGIIDIFKKVSETYNVVRQKNIEKFTKKFAKEERKYDPSREVSVSDQDIFVMATVLFYGHHFSTQKITLVTKENNSSTPTRPVKIPHICDELGIRWIDDFTFIKEVGIKLNARLS